MRQTFWEMWEHWKRFHNDPLILSPPSNCTESSAVPTTTLHTSTFEGLVLFLRFGNGGIGRSTFCILLPCSTFLKKKEQEILFERMLGAWKKNSPLSSDFCLSYLLTVICPKKHCRENFANDLGLLTFDFLGQFCRWYARNSDINIQTWTIHAITSDQQEHIWVWVAHCYMNSKKRIKKLPCPFRTTCPQCPPSYVESVSWPTRSLHSWAGGGMPPNATPPKK